MTAIIDCICFLWREGLVFHSRDEPKESNNQENFFELLRFFVNHNQGINDVVLDKSLGYLKNLSP